MRIFTILITTGLVLLLFSNNSLADPIYQYLFTGTAKINSILDGNGSGLGSLDVDTGVPVSGFFWVDTNLIDVDFDPTHAQYNHYITSGVTIFIDGSIIQISEYTANVNDNYNIGGTEYDLFQVQIFGNATLEGMTIDLSNSDIDFTHSPNDTFSCYDIPDSSVITNWGGDIDLTVREGGYYAGFTSIM